MSSEGEGYTLKSEPIWVLQFESQLTGVGRIARDRCLRSILQREGLRTRTDREIHGHRTVRRLVPDFDVIVGADAERLRNAESRSSGEHLAIEFDRRVTPTQTSFNPEGLRSVLR